MRMQGPVLEDGFRDFGIRPGARQTLREPEVYGSADILEECFKGEMTLLLEGGVRERLPRCGRGFHPLPPSLECPLH